MNDKPKPWSVKGISPEARRLARQAAQEAGLPIGRWLDTIIQQQAGTPIAIDRGTSKRAPRDESRIEDLVATLSGKIDDMTMRLALVQTGRGLPPEDIARLDRMRIGGTFEYDEDTAEPTPIVATQTQSEQSPRARHGLRYAVFCAFLLMGLASSYIAVSGALVVPPAGLTNAISQITATVGPALRDLGFSGSAPVQPAVAGKNNLPDPPMSQVSLRDSRPARSLESRAQDGNATAQYELARAHAAGKDRPQSHEKAVHWLKLAANRGHTQAIYELAEVYADGRGVPASAAKSAAWYGKAAAKGHRSAQYALGLAYAEGNGVPRDYDQATTWLERAAKAGRADAQFALALLHERGFAANASLENAQRWYKSAAKNGFPQAAQRAQALTQHQVGIPLTPPRAVNDSASISEIQKLLMDLGFDPGPVDGQIGDKTNAAIRLYQAALGLKIDGEPTDHLLAHLRTVIGNESTG